MSELKGYIPVMYVCTGLCNMSELKKGHRVPQLHLLSEPRMRVCPFLVSYATAKLQL